MRAVSHRERALHLQIRSAAHVYDSVRNAVDAQPTGMSVENHGSAVRSILLARTAKAGISRAPGWRTRAGVRQSLEIDMRIVGMAVVFALACTIASCSKSPTGPSRSAPSTPPATLVGTWQASALAGDDLGSRLELG
jgi:hypothetical protein